MDEFIRGGSLMVSPLHPPYEWEENPHLAFCSTSPTLQVGRKPPPCILLHFFLKSGIKTENYLVELKKAFQKETHYLMGQKDYLKNHFCIEFQIL